MVSITIRKYDPKQPRDPGGEGGGQWVGVGVGTSAADRLRDAYRSKSALFHVDGIRDEGGVISPGDYANVIAYQTHTTSLGSSMRRGILTERERQIRGTLDQIVQRSESRRDIRVTRGVANPHVTFGSAWNDDGDNTGLTWRDEAFVPGTVHINIAEQIAKDRAKSSGTDEVLMHVLVPKGTKAAKLNTDEYYYHGEILINRGSTFRIIKDHGKPTSGPRVLDVEVIPERVVRQQMQNWIAQANAPAIPDVDVKFPEWPKVPIMAEAKSARDADASDEKELQPNDWNERFVDRGAPVAILRPVDPGGRSQSDDPELRHRVLRALGVFDERRFDPKQPRDPGGEGGGQWVKGGGAAGAVKKVIKAASSIADVERELQEDREVAITPDVIDTLMVSVAKKDAFNLAHLDVEGKENENLFTHHVREIPRSEMPQLPSTVETIKPFGDKLAKMGVAAKIVQMDPRQLKMTQNQLDSKKVGKLYGYMKEGGWQEGGVLIASSDGAVLDGHHRWAGASAVAASGQLVPPPPPHPIKVTVLQVDLPIDDLLKVANESSGPRKGLGEEN